MVKKLASGWCGIMMVKKNKKGLSMMTEEEMDYGLIGIRVMAKSIKGKWK